MMQFQLGCSNPGYYTKPDAVVARVSRLTHVELHVLPVMSARLAMSNFRRCSLHFAPRFTSLSLSCFFASCWVVVIGCSSRTRFFLVAFSVLSLVSFSVNLSYAAVVRSLLVPGLLGDGCPSRTVVFLSPAIFIFDF